MAILSTKLFRPTPRDGMIMRQRLINLVEQGVQTKLTLVSAPPGFGKTTLISGWAQQSGVSTCWLSLDEQDNDPVRFLKYLVAALQQVVPGFGEAIIHTPKSTAQLYLEDTLTLIINELVSELTSIVLILDDFHVITEPQILEGMLFLIDHLPPQLHLMILTRANPPWPLARLRMHGEIIELRADDLRFNSNEALDFLSNSMGLKLTPEDLDSLETQTEGWIAGLQMAALSMQGHPDTQAFIRSFSGSNRFIFDYLFEEVFSRQTARVQEFVLATSILERLCAPLCEAATGFGDVQTLLLDLEQANLFIIPLDEERRWYRYHHLFADLLRNRIQQTHPEAIPSLHQKASSWYFSNDYLPEALQHAFLAQDFPGISQMIATDVLKVLEQTELQHLLRQLEFVPDDVITAYPWMSIASAWISAQTGSFEKALQHLSLAKTPLTNLSNIDADQGRHISGHIRAIEAYIEVYSIGDYQRASNFAAEALNALPQSDSSARNLVTILLSTIQRVQFDLTSALETLNNAINHQPVNQQEHTAVEILGQIARIHRDQGDLNKAASVCEQAIQIATQSSKHGRGQIPISAYVMGTQARIFYEWNRLPEALEIGENAIALARKWGQFNTLLGNQLLLVKIYRQYRKFPEATGALAAAKELSRQISHVHSFVIKTHEAALNLEMGNFKAASDSLEQLEISSLSDEQKEELAPLILTLYRNGQFGSLDDLIVSLSRLQAFYSEKQMTDHSIKTCIQCALAWAAAGNPSRAIETLSEALPLGRAGGYLRSFLDPGEPMADLLRQACLAGIEPDYTSKLLGLLAQETAHTPFPPGGELHPDPLTERELEVLRLLAAGSSIPEIAADMVISVNTLRTHTKRIYSKLNVHSRFEAVTRAQSLNLL